MTTTSTTAWSSTTRNETVAALLESARGGPLAPPPCLRSLGDHVPPGHYSLHSRFEHCLNFVNGDSLVALVDETVGNGPFNIVTSASVWGSADSLRVTDRWIAMDGVEIPTVHVARYSSALTLPAPPAHTTLRRHLNLLEQVVIADSPPRSLAFLLGGAPVARPHDAFERAFRDRCRRGLDLLSLGDLAGAADTFRGTGYGLTPSGDDFLCGLLVASHLAQAVDGNDRSTMREIIHRVARGGNLLSNSFLRAAYQGWLHEPVKRLILALTGADDSALVQATRQALARGETSGSDMAVGLAVGTNLWTQSQQ